MKTGSQYEVLNPWSEVDPIPLKGISPRLSDLKGKTIGLFCNWKAAAHPILSVVERNLKEKEPSLNFSWFTFNYNATITETDEKGKFEDWVKKCHAVISAVGD